MKESATLSKKIKFMISFVVIVCFGLLFIFSGFRWLNQYLVVHAPIDHADALVLMAGESRKRLPAVAELFKQKVAPVVLLTNDGVVSAWSREGSRNLYQVEWAKIKLVDRYDIPQNAIVELLFTKSGSYYDALNTRAYVQANGIKSLAIVTSDYHTRRTLWSFAEVFSGTDVKLGVYPVALYSGSEGCFGQARRFGILLVEFLKLNYYKVRHGILRKIF